MLTEADVRKALESTIKSQKPRAWDLRYDFRKGGELDSLDHASFLLSLAESHGLVVPDQDVDKLTSIEAVLDYAVAKMK